MTICWDITHIRRTSRCIDTRRRYLRSQLIPNLKDEKWWPSVPISKYVLIFLATLLNTTVLVVESVTMHFTNTQSFFIFLFRATTLPSRAPTCQVLRQLLSLTRAPASTSFRRHQQLAPSPPSRLYGTVHIISFFIINPKQVRK